MRSPHIFMYMEVNFSELKKKEVINLTDGKHLGRVCNVAFSFPEGKVSGFTVTGSKGFKFTKAEVFLPLKCVNKIGEDAVLVTLNKPAPPQPPPANGFPQTYCPPQPRRSLDEYE